MEQIVISGTGVFTPEESITNEELVRAYNEYAENYNLANKNKIDLGEKVALELSNEEFIFNASGIKNRYVMDKKGILDPNIMHPILDKRTNDQPSILAEMSLKASKDALDKAGKTPDDIDAVITACSNLERAYPAISIEVQELLGIKGFAFDMNVACSSATFGIQTIFDMVKSGSIKSAIMINPEICTGHLNFRDRDCHFIFGDVATAVILERLNEENIKENSYEIIGTRLLTKFSNNIRNNYGFLNNSSPDGVGQSDKLFHQNGRKVFKEVVPEVSNLIKSHLEENNLSANDLKGMYLHQANENMNVLISKYVLGKDAPKELAPVVLDEYANTSSAGSIIAFHKYNKSLNKNDLAIICSFGAGYSVGNVIVKKIA